MAGHTRWTPVLVLGTLTMLLLFTSAELVKFRVNRGQEPGSPYDQPYEGEATPPMSGANSTDYNGRAFSRLLSLRLSLDRTSSGIGFGNRNTTLAEDNTSGDRFTSGVPEKKREKKPIELPSQQPRLRESSVVDRDSTSGLHAMNCGGYGFFGPLTRACSDAKFHAKAARPGSLNTAALAKGFVGDDSKLPGLTPTTLAEAVEGLGLAQDNDLPYPQRVGILISVNGNWWWLFVPISNVDVGLKVADLAVRLADERDNWRSASWVQNGWQVSDELVRRALLVKVTLTDGRTVFCYCFKRSDWFSIQGWFSDRGFECDTMSQAIRSCIALDGPRG